MTCSCSRSRFEIRLFEHADGRVSEADDVDGIMVMLENHGPARLITRCRHLLSGKQLLEMLDHTCFVILSRSALNSAKSEDLHAPDEETGVVGQKCSSVVFDSLRSID